MFIIPNLKYIIPRIDLHLLTCYNLSAIFSAELV